MCFFAPVSNRRMLEHAEYYKQDIDILRELGFDVTIATSWSEIPWTADFYFVWWWTWAFLPILKARLHKRPVLITGTFDYRWPIPGYDYHSRPEWQKSILRLSLRLSSANVFVSQLEYLGVTGGLGIKNGYYVPHVLNTDLYSEGIGERDDIVLTVAGLQKPSAERKCVHEIIRCVPFVRASHPSVRFTIAGEHGSAYAELQTLARKLKVDDVLSFPGVIPRDCKIRLMQQCKVYLQPSVYEGFGVAILEAMSCGAAVVSNPVGAVPEVVGDAGLLVEGRSPEILASVVNRLLSDAPLRRDLGQRARERVKTLFSFERRKSALERIIRDIFASR